jgi:hypothetical protein
MADNIGVVQVILSAKDQSLAAEMRKARKEVADFHESVKGAFQSIAAVTAGWATMEGIKKAAEFVKVGMDQVSMLRENAQMLGVTTEQMAGLSLAAEKSGVKQEQLAASIAKMQKNISEANVENRAAVELFDRLGISLAELKGKDTAESLGIIADRISQMGDAGDATTAAMEMFGKGGYQMLDMLREGSEGFATATNDAKQLGLAFSNLDTAQVEEAQKQLRTAQKATEALGQTFAVELSPYITEAANAFIQAAKDSNGFKDTIRKVVEFAVSAVQFMIDGWLRLEMVWTALRVGVMWLFKTIMDGITYVVGLGENMGRAFKANWELISASGVLAWKFIKSTFWDFISWGANKFGWFLSQIGMGLNSIKSGMGDAFVDAAFAVTTAVGKMAGTASKEYKEALAVSGKAAQEFKDANLNMFKVDLDKVGMGETWQRWRQNITDNFNDEKRKLYAQNDARIRINEQVQTVIDNAKANARTRAIAQEQKAEQQKTKNAVTEAQNRAKEIQRAENRDKFLASADSDPRVKYEREVLNLLKDSDHLRTLDESRAMVAQRQAQEAQWRDPKMDPKVAYEQKVAYLVMQERDRQAAEMIKREREEQRIRMQASAEFFGNLATLTEEAAKGNEAMFWANKGFQMAQAEINAWMAYSAVIGNQQLNQLMGPIATQVMAATALAAGQMAVAQIAAAQPQGRAMGGPVSRGSMYEVNERGPELLSVGDRTFLMMGSQDGHVTPNSGGPGRGPQVVVNVQTAPGTTARVEQSGTEQQPKINVIVEMIKREVAGEIRGGQGQIASAMKEVYGVNRARGAF